MVFGTAILDLVPVYHIVALFACNAQDILSCLALYTNCIYYHWFFVTALQLQNKNNFFKQISRN